MVAPAIPAPVISVRLELGRIVEAAAEVLERRAIRREQREDDFWADLQDDLQASSYIVRELNKLYGRTLNDIQLSAGRHPSAKARNAALKNAHAFLRDDTVIGMITELNGRFAAASQDDKLNGRRFRLIGEVVHGVHDALDEYLRHLIAMQNDEPQFIEEGVRRWTLAEVRNALEGKDQEFPLYELCEQAIRNRRKDAVYAIDKLVGEAIQTIGNRKLRRR